MPYNWTKWKCKPWKYLNWLPVGLMVYTATKLVVSFSDCGSTMPPGLRLVPYRLLALLVTSVAKEQLLCSYCLCAPFHEVVGFDSKFIPSFVSGFWKLATDQTSTRSEWNCQKWERFNFKTLYENLASCGTLFNRMSWKKTVFMSATMKTEVLWTFLAETRLQNMGDGELKWSRWIN